MQPWVTLPNSCTLDPAKETRKPSISPSNVEKESQTAKQSF